MFSLLFPARNAFKVTVYQNCVRQNSSVLNYASYSSLYGEEGTRNRTPLKLDLDLNKLYLKRISEEIRIRQQEFEIENLVNVHTKI